MSDTLTAVVSSTARQRGQPAVFVGLSGDDPQAPSARISLVDVDRVDIGRADKRRIDRRTVDGSKIVTLLLTDPRMSGNHARLSRVGGTWIIEDMASKNGTWIGASKVSRHTLTDSDVIVVGHTALVFRDTGGENFDLDGDTPEIAPGLATLSLPLAERYIALAQAAKSNVPIQISGDTGTGKELVARAVHAASGREGRFIAVNCGGLVQGLVEGDLFGHKRGAYTGAMEDRPGLLRSAHGGTLFLDEVAELPAGSQAALLRVLQEGEVVPLGADRVVKVDVRLVTATHRDLALEVAANRFRADLRARLLGFQIELPPLRHRREDLGLIVKTLLKRLAPERPIVFSADAVSALYSHDWPLNVRELERALAAALAVATEGRIKLSHLPTAFATPGPPETPVPPVDLSPDERVLRDQLIEAITRHAGNITSVAREMGKDRTQIRRWMKRFGITRDVKD